MRIDEIIVNDKSVVNEAPVGLMKRAGNFLQSKIGLTKDMRARGQGKRDVSQIANNISTKVNQKVGQAGIDNKDMNQMLSQDYKDLVLGVIKEIGMAPEFAKVYDQEWNKLLGQGSKYMDDTGKIPKTNSVQAAGGAQKLVDQVILNTVQQASKIPGLINNLPDADGDGEPDQPKGGGAGGGGAGGGGAGQPLGNPQAVGGPAQQAVAGALEKLDPDLQAFAFQYLQSKAQ